MILITGGVYQGKRAFAKELAEDLATDVVAGAVEKIEIIDNCDKTIRNQLREGKNPREILTFWTLGNWDNKILIFNDVSMGIVPMEKEERIFRETVGQVGGMLAQKADSVYRVFCGISQKIK